MTWILAAALAAALGFAVPAMANDSSSELAAGGLVLTRTDGITMQREDLTLSPSEVRVRYEMRNDTGKPITLRVAFPLPEVPKETPGGMETTGGAHNIDMPPPADPNFIGFRVTADGREITPEVEIRADLPDGRNITEALRQIGGLKLVLQPRIFEHQEGAAWDLDAATRRKLQDLGALTQDADSYDLLWTTRITFHWMQTFRPGVTVVEHVYHPVIGSQLYGVDRDLDIGVWHGSADEDLAKAYCIDRGTDRAMRAVYKRVLQARRTPGDSYILGYTLGYILQTAKNWHGPIGTFHLTLLGGRVATPFSGGGETRVMSLCTDLPLRQTAPMRFEATVSNYVPKQDLRVFLVTE